MITEENNKGNKQQQTKELKRKWMLYEKTEHRKMKYKKGRGRNKSNR
jgi:hypothetical protein